MSAYIHLEIEDARARKWSVGQQKYGPKFVGHPLEQFDEEMLDALNYVDEAERWGFDMGSIAVELRGICERVRAM